MTKVNVDLEVTVIISAKQYMQFKKYIRKKV